MAAVLGWTGRCVCRLNNTNLLVITTLQAVITGEVNI